MRQWTLTEGELIQIRDGLASLQVKPAVFAKIERFVGKAPVVEMPVVETPAPAQDDEEKPKRGRKWREPEKDEE